MSKPWGNIGTWAAEAEREEAEEAAAAAEPQTFPSLKEAVSAKPKKKKMSLNEFYTTSVGLSGGGTAARGFESRGLTPDEMLRLPTGPKERSAEEMQYGRLGGGFSNYGRSGPPPGRMRDNTDGTWGGGGGRRFTGGFEEERRGPPARVSDYDHQASRADEAENWSMTKKPISSFDNSRQNRYGSLGGGGGHNIGSGSRADEVDNWTAGKKPLTSFKSSTFGSGFRDSGLEPDRWTRRLNQEPERERPPLVIDSLKSRDGGGTGYVAVKAVNRPSPFGEARPREEVLADKGLDWKKLEMEIEAKKTTSSRPTSAQSSRPSSAQSNMSEQGMENVAVKPRPKVNPFGDAKPREVLLQERGQDWRKIDLELDHRRVDRPETEQEKLLKEEIDHLKKELEQRLIIKGNNESDGDQSSIPDIISDKERELEMLICDLDDKVRYGQKDVERPGSGAGRSTGSSERPPSRSGSFDESRSVEFMYRPRSRGTQDVWTRPADERRSFHGGRERGFLGSRDFDRSRTRDRW